MPAAVQDGHRATRPPWRALALAGAVVVLGAVAWSASRPATSTFCTLAGYLPPPAALAPGRGGPPVRGSRGRARLVVERWRRAGHDGARPRRPLRLSPEGGEPVTPATLRPSGPGDFERRGDDWAWELGDGRELRVQLVEEPGGWTIVGVNTCEVRRG